MRLKNHAAKGLAYKDFASAMNIEAVKRKGEKADPGRARSYVRLCSSAIGDCAAVAIALAEKLGGIVDHACIRREPCVAKIMRETAASPKALVRCAQSLQFDGCRAAQLRNKPSVRATAPGLPYSYRASSCANTMQWAIG
jgi:hypothetical protein